MPNDTTATASAIRLIVRSTEGSFTRIEPETGSAQKKCSANPCVSISGGQPLFEKSGWRVAESDWKGSTARQEYIFFSGRRLQIGRLLGFE